MRRVYFVCSSANHLRLALPLAQEYRRQGATLVFLSADRANAPEGGGVTEELERPENRSALGEFQHIRLDEGLDRVSLPEKGFRALSLWERIRLLRKIRGPRLDFAGSLVILFNDSGAFEKRVLSEARRRGALTVFVQDGFTSLRSRNPLSLLYYQLLKLGPWFNYLPMPQAAGPWNLGFFLGPFWAEYSRSWHVSTRPTCLAIGQLKMMGESASPSPTPSGVLRIGLLSANFAAVRDGTPEAEARFLEALAEGSLSTEGVAIEIRPHPRETGAPKVAEVLSRRGVAFSISQAREPLGEFIARQDLLISLGSYAAFDAHRMGRPCFVVMGCFGIQAAILARLWGEPSEREIVEAIRSAIERMKRDRSEGPRILEELRSRYSRVVSPEGVDAARLVSLIEKYRPSLEA